MEIEIKQELYEKLLKDNERLRELLVEYKERLRNIVHQRKINPKTEWYVSYLQTENFRFERQYAKLQEDFHAILASQRQCQEHLEQVGIFIQEDGTFAPHGNNRDDAGRDGGNNLRELRTEEV